MNKLMVLAISVLIAGCATTANYEELHHTWVGDSAVDLVKAWGPPQTSVKQPDGSQVLEYTNHRVMRDSTYNSTELSSYTSGNNGIGPEPNGSNGPEYASGMNLTRAIPQDCTARFIVNSQGIITNWSLQGNKCRTQSLNQ